MKICSKCKELKDEIQFSKCTRGKNGLQPWCKECMYERSKTRYNNDLEYRKKFNIRTNKHHKNRYNNDKEYRLKVNSIHSARHKKLFMELL